MAMELNDQELRMYEKWLDEANDKAYQLEQRYQRLENVAEKMYGFMNLIFDDIGIDPTFTSAATHEVMNLRRFRYQLEALGVSLDD